MSLTKALIIAALFVFVKTEAQTTEEKELQCQNFLKSGSDSYKLRDYTEASAFYVKALDKCEHLSVIDYNYLVISLKNSISSQKENSRKQAYIDTLLYVYERGEKTGLYDQINDLNYAAYVLNSAHPDRNLADRLFVRGLNNSGYFSGDTYLNLYYANLYEIYKKGDTVNITVNKQRLLFEYFRISDWIEEGKLSEKLRSNVSLYFNDVFKSCDDLEPVIRTYFKSLDPKKELNSTELNNLKGILEEKECLESKEYERVIDSLLYTESSTELFLIKAQILRQRGDFSKEFSSLYFARKRSRDAEEQEMIDLLSAESLYNAGNLNEAYKITLTIKGKYKNDGSKLAALCVAGLAEKCGTTPLERKLNYYFALQLLESINNKDETTLELITTYKLALPSENELKEAGLVHGQSVSLKCWDVLILIP